MASLWNWIADFLALPNILSFAAPAAYGDLLTTGLAGLSVFALWLRPGLALPLVWLFNLVGITDLLFAIYEGLVIGLPFFHLGVAWLIPTLYVPLLLVSHVTIFGSCCVLRHPPR
jgi:hypothetical protein